MPHTAKPIFSGVMKHFCWKLTKTSLYGLKVTSQKEAKITQKDIFYNGFEKGLILRIFLFLETIIFVQRNEIGQILSKTVLLLKMCHIQPN